MRSRNSDIDSGVGMLDKYWPDVVLHPDSLQQSSWLIDTTWFMAQPNAMRAIRNEAACAKTFHGPRTHSVPYVYIPVS